LRHPGAVYGHNKMRPRRPHSLFRTNPETGKPGSKLWYKRIYSGGSWNQFVLGKSLGMLLQVCCGGSDVGLARVDIDILAPCVNIVADQCNLPFRNESFDSVACDPIYELDYPNRIKLQRELARVARRRIIFKAPWIPRATGWWLSETVLIGSHTCSNVAVMTVLDRIKQTDNLF
jgi:hypothetical protein